MVKNTKGGNKAKKTKNSIDRTAGRPLVLKKESDEIYGRVLKRLGGEPPILEVQCLDREIRRCVIRGKMKKKVWMNPDDIVLVKYNKDNFSSLDDKNKIETGEILHKYQANEIIKLKNMGEIDNYIIVQKFSEDNQLVEDDNFDFEDDNNLINNLSISDQNQIEESSSSEDSINIKDI